MFINDFQTENLTDEQWNIAHGIAKSLIERNTDVNEFKKIISYLRNFIDRDNAGAKFFVYLEVMEKNGKKIGHSGKTIEYYRQIKKVCKKHLKKFENNPLAMLTILGWAARLMQYYKVAPVGETVDDNSNIIIENSEDESSNFSKDELYEAKVIKLKEENIEKGKKKQRKTTITYEVKKSDTEATEVIYKQKVNLVVGDIVKVKIEKVTGNSVRKVKIIDRDG